MENNEHFFMYLPVETVVYMVDIRIILNAELSFIMKEKVQNIHGAEGRLSLHTLEAMKIKVMR